MILDIVFVWVIVIPVVVTALGWWRGTGELSRVLVTPSADRREITLPPPPIRMGTGSATGGGLSGSSRGMISSR